MKGKHTKHSLTTKQFKGNEKEYFNTQLKTIFSYLENHICTATMLYKATGIPQKSITRYKRDLEKKGLLFELYKKPCKVTKHKAWYLTTNKETYYSVTSKKS